MNASDEATLAFYSWETKLRGWHLYQEPVDLEQYFEVIGTDTERVRKHDDGKVSLFGALLPQKTREVERVGLVAKVFETEERLYCLRIYPSNDNETSRSELLQFLLLISRSGMPVSFELYGTHQEIELRFLCYGEDKLSLKAYLSSYYPELRYEASEGRFSFHDVSEIGIVEYGLHDEVHRPISGFSSTQVDPLKSFYAILEQLQQGESAVLQIGFQKAVQPWSNMLSSSVVNPDGSSFFGDDGEMVPLTREKISNQLVFASVRMVCQSVDETCTEQLASRLHQSLSGMERIGSNALIPLSNVGLPYEEHLQDILHRTSHRPGMLLNLDELSSFVHFPDRSIPSQKLFGTGQHSHPVPDELTKGQFVLGTNQHEGISQEVSIHEYDRLKHTHVIGSTGVGKSTFLVNLALQDAALGNGFTVFDPHGDLIDDILLRLPEHRLKDVILFDPSDSDYPIGINLLEARSEPEKIILSSDLVSVFKRQSTSWGDQMSNILQMAVGCFLERDTTGTLVELRFFLQNDGFRKKVLLSVTDPMLRYFWLEEYPTYRKGVATPILSRLNSFLGPKALRHAMAIREGLNLNEVLSQKKILLCKLSQGLIGEDNSNLLGTLLLSKLYQAALARQNTAKENRAPHFVYLDEFHNFLSSSLPGIITGVRKYGLGLVMAHQNLEQISRRDNELKSTLLGNAYTRIAFRVGDDDASVIQRGTQHFEAEHYTSLSVGQAIGKAGGSSSDFNLTTKSLKSPLRSEFDLVLKDTRQRYSQDKSEVSKTIAKLYELKRKNQEDTHIEELIETKQEQVKQREPENFEKSKQEYHSREVNKKALQLHRYVQEAIKGQAQSFGWKATIEYPVESGRVDVLLERDDIKVGVEVSVTNSADYEMENVKKCFRHGCNGVFLVVPNDNKRIKLEQRAQLEIDAEDAKNLKVTNQQGVTDWLMKANQQQRPKTEIVGGYRVKVNYEDGYQGQAEKTLRDAILTARKEK